MAKDFNISRPIGQCSACEVKLEQGQQYMALVIDCGNELIRSDWCMNCWDDNEKEKPADIFGQWRSTIAVKQPKKKLFVDDALLLNFFERLEGDEKPGREEFRFVLALILMRKKQLSYEGSTRDASGKEIWKMKPRKSENVHEVINPQLDDEQISQVSEQLSEILQGDF